MKIKNILFGMMALIISISSCTKKLDQISQTSITSAVFWKDSSSLISAVNYLYTSVPDFNTPLEDLYSDFAVDVRTTSVNSISDGSRVAPASDGQWNSAYNYIRAANNIIEKSALVPDGPMKTFCIGQARFFRALAYYKLVRAYGDVPFLGRTLAGRDDEGLYTPRTSRGVVVDSIYADLDFAASVCPQADQLPGSPSVAGTTGREYGRITRSAALALKSRVGLFEGTFEKFHSAPEFTGTKNAAKHLTVARDAALAIINEGRHSLYTKDGELSYQTLFRYPGETYANNKENILVRLYGKDITNVVAANGGYMRTYNNDGGNAATRAYVLTALYADGLPAGKSPLDSNGKETGLLTDYQNRDPRMVLTLFKPGDPSASISGSNPTYGNTLYYHQQKYFTGQADFMNSPNIFLDFISIRYGEVLLNYAEATFELNESITDADLNLSINKLRNRATNNNTAKLALLTNAFVTANNLNMRDEIRRDRSIELAFEGFRYWDLLRWKTAETQMPKAVLERKYFPGLNYGGTGVPTLLNGYVLFQPAEKRAFNPAKDYLWPIPTAQIGLSNNTLTQNPNWN